MNPGHKKRKQIEPSNKNEKQQDTNMNDMLRKMKEISLENENNDDDQEDDKNEKCDKANCKIDEASGDEIYNAGDLQCGKRY